MYELSGFINPLYDFSIPSSLTNRTDNTYDGKHYDIETNSLVAKRINGGESEFGLCLNDISKEEYRRLFYSSLKNKLPYD